MRPRPHLSSKSLIFTNTSIYTCLKLWFITKTWPRTPIHLLIVCFVGWLTHLGWRGAVKFPILPRKASFLTLKDFSSITTTRSSLLSINETKSLSFSMSIVHLHMRCSIQVHGLGTDCVHKPKPIRFGCCFFPWPSYVKIVDKAFALFSALTHRLFLTFHFALLNPLTSLIHVQHDSYFAKKVCKMKLTHW